MLYFEKFNPHEFSFSGYFRTGLGKSNGGQMVDYVTLENVHKFRMDNEANHYGELKFDYKYKNKDSVDLYEISLKMSKYVPFGSTALNQFHETSKLFAKINSVYNSL